MCDIGNIQVRIVGVCYQSNYLWFIVESDQVKTYMVYEFHKKDTIYETVIDSKRIKRIVPLQKMWSIDESIHPFDGGRRLLSAYGLDESQYEWKINLKMKNHSTISGGIVFIFEKDKVIFLLSKFYIINLIFKKISLKSMIFQPESPLQWRHFLNDHYCYHWKRN